MCALEGLCQASGFLVLHGYAVTLDGAPGSNITAHDAATDHVYMAGVECKLLALAFELLLQEVHAYQVFRCRRGGQLRNRYRFFAQHALRVVRMTLPQVDQVIGCRVVRLLRLARHLLAHLLCNKWT